MIRGAGGLSIAPSLQFQSVWGRDSERYQKTYEMIRDCSGTGFLVPTLLSAFSEQRLSPYDAFYQEGDDGVDSLMDVCSQIPLPKTWLLLKIDNLHRILPVW